MSVLEDRLPWLETFKLETGTHTPDGAACIMEAVSYIAGEPWSDHPQCVSPVIGAFCRSWNDSLNDTDREMLRPYAVKVIGTNTSGRDDEKRAWLATDWLVRECAPAFLRCAGLTEHAETLENLAALTTAKRAASAQPKIDAARDAARDAAWAAAWDAAGDAAWGAAGAAAWGAAGAAAWAAAGAAARGAAGAAARDAAGAALDPTVKLLQPSALQLLDRMIAVGAK